MSNINDEIDELKKKKLELEIALLNKKWYENNTFIVSLLGLIFTLLIGYISGFWDQKLAELRIEKKLLTIEQKDLKRTNDSLVIKKSQADNLYNESIDRLKKVKYLDLKINYKIDSLDSIKNIFINDKNILLNKMKIFEEDKFKLKILNEELLEKTKIAENLYSDLLIREKESEKIKDKLVENEKNLKKILRSNTDLNDSIKILLNQKIITEQCLEYTNLIQNVSKFIESSMYYFTHNFVYSSSEERCKGWCKLNHEDAQEFLMSIKNDFEKIKFNDPTHTKDNLKNLELAMNINQRFIDGDFDNFSFKKKSTIMQELINHLHSFRFDIVVIRDYYQNCE